MCKLYILLTFGLGLLSGWLVTFLLSEGYKQKPPKSGEESGLATAVESYHKHPHLVKTFRFSVKFWILFFMLATFSLFIIWSAAKSDHNEIKNELKGEMTKSIDKADNKEIFEGLVEGMKEFLR